MGKDKSKIPKEKNGGNSDSGSSSESEDKMDLKEYRKLLSKIFPSQHLSKKIKEMESQESKGKKTSKKSSESPKSTKSTSENIKISQKSSPSSKRRKVEPISVKESSDSSSSDSNSDSDDYSDDEINQIMKGKKNQKFNIIFTMGGPLSINQSILEENGSDMDMDDEDDSDMTSYSDTESDMMSEDSEGSSSEEEDKEYHPRRSKRLQNKKMVAESSSESSSDDDRMDINDKELLDQYNGMVTNLLEKNKKSKLLKSLKKDAEERKRVFEIDTKKRFKKQRAKNLTAFRSLVKEKNPMNDLRFFRDELSVDDQSKMIEEIREVKSLMTVEKPYRLKLLDADIPREFKACALKKVNTLRYMEPNSGEYYKLKNWVDTFMRIPFGSYGSLPITINDGVEKCHDFMEKAQHKLDEAVFGLNDAKIQIMQMIGQWIANPKAIGTAIAIKGPMGTGKTTLVKDGISQILGRDFAFIALGGATDSSFLEGHSYTYEGSTWGKIVDILLRCRTMNPVIYFDELDKISDTPKGEEIAGILTHLTDTSQNSKFHDKYFSEVDFDLSKCLFIFSYNDERRVNPILKDRMYSISTTGYKKSEKIHIANGYLLPKIREQCNFKQGEIIIPDETIEYIADSYTYNEEGVRNLKRCLEIIHTKLNLFRLMKEGTNLFEQQMSLKVSFPFTITKDLVDQLIKKEDTYGPPEGMYV
jgi:ATP-dependent Lon protease